MENKQTLIIKNLYAVTEQPRLLINELDSILFKYCGRDYHVDFLIKNDGGEAFRNRESQD